MSNPVSRVTHRLCCNDQTWSDPCPDEVEAALASLPAGSIAVLEDSRGNFVQLAGMSGPLGVLAVECRLDDRQMRASRSQVSPLDVRSAVIHGAGMLRVFPSEVLRSRDAVIIFRTFLQQGIADPAYVWRELLPEEVEPP